MVAISVYNVFLAAHVLAAVAWVGGGATLTLLAFLTARDHDPVQMVHFAKRAAFCGQYLYGPASLIVLAFGLAMVERGNWGFDHVWVQFGLAAENFIGRGRYFIAGVTLAVHVTFPQFWLFSSRTARMARACKGRADRCCVLILASESSSSARRGSRSATRPTAWRVATTKTMSKTSPTYPISSSVS